GPGPPGRQRRELAGGLLDGDGHGPDHERIQHRELTPDLGDRAPAAQARDHELAPAAHDLVLVVAHVHGHPPLAAINVHGCAFLYIRCPVSHVPPNSTSAPTRQVCEREARPGHTILVYYRPSAESVGAQSGRTTLLDGDPRRQRGGRRAGRTRRHLEPAV